jgi:hypothetical protein
MMGKKPPRSFITNARIQVLKIQRRIIMEGAAFGLT